MKLVVGMGTIDDYPALVKAGADELFCGYIPADWGNTFGRETAMNRREVLFPNVQIGSESELAILAQMQSHYQIPVTLTLNAPVYPEAAIPYLLNYIRRCITIGFDSFIIADENLLKAIKESGLDLKLHLSGEYGELNHLVLQELSTFTEIERVILPRQTTIDEMKQLISLSHVKNHEAFFLNEKCHFTGAYCNSLHSDFFCHICQLPYKIEDRHAMPSETSQAPNASGCAYCALWRLRDAGITHLKIVSRGNYTEETIKDVKRAKLALQFLEQATLEEEYISAMKKALFPEGCSRNCYYTKGHV